MAELAARIIERKCSLPVVVLIHLDGERGGNGSLSVANSSITLERSVVHSKRKFCWPGCLNDDE